MEQLVSVHPPALLTKFLCTPKATAWRNTRLNKLHRRQGTLSSPFHSLSMAQPQRHSLPLALPSEKPMMQTQCMTVDPYALPWAAWPAWRPLGQAFNAGITKTGTAPSSAAPADSPQPSAVPPHVQVQDPLAHILSDQPLLQAADTLPADDAGLVTLRTAAQLLKTGHIAAIPTVSAPVPSLFIQQCSYMQCV